MRPLKTYAVFDIGPFVLSQASVLVPSDKYTDVDMEPYDIALYSVEGGESVLYWTDTGYNYIRAIYLDGRGRDAKVIMHEEEQQPRTLAVEPNERYHD